MTVFPYSDVEEILAVKKVIMNNFLNEGQAVRDFEKEFAKFVGAKYCVMTTSGSMALYHALLSIKNVYPSTVPTIVPSYMGIFVAHALKQIEISPEIVDVNELGLMMESGYIEDSFYVHANGRVCYDTHIQIEDCSQAIHHHTKNAISCYSFAPTKHITTGGQGGAICTDSKHIYEKLHRIKDHGRLDRMNMETPKDVFTEWGTNFKVTEIQASFGLAQLKKLPKRLERFEQIYNIYRDELFGKVGFLEIPSKWQVDIMVEDPDDFIKYMKSHDIPVTRIHKPIHIQPEFSQSKIHLGQSMELYNHGIFLPSTTNQKDDEILDICKVVKKYDKSSN